MGCRKSSHSQITNQDFFIQKKISRYGNGCKYVFASVFLFNLRHYNVKENKNQPKDYNYGEN